VRITLPVLAGLVVFAAIVAVVLIAARHASRPARPPAPVQSLAERGYLRLDPVEPERPGGRPNWLVSPLRPMDSRLSERERAWYGAVFVGGAAPVYWSDVRAPAAPPDDRAGYGTGDGWGGDGGGFGDGGCGDGGGGDGGGGGGD